MNQRDYKQLGDIVVRFAYNAEQSASLNHHWRLATQTLIENMVYYLRLGYSNFNDSSFRAYVEHQLHMKGLTL